MDNYINNSNNIINNNDIIKISGTIGMVKLVSNDKNVFMFYDDHSNTTYCNNSDSIFLYEVFDNIVNNNGDYIILLEEPFVKNYSNIKFLWNETPHIIKFRNFYKKIIQQCSDTKKCNVFPIDIRLIICDVSIDELMSNLDHDEYFKNYKISVYEYFKQLLYLFDYIEWDDKIFFNTDTNIKFIKKVFNKFLYDNYYLKLKSEFNKLYDKYIEPNESIDINIFLKENKDVLYIYSSGYPFENLNKTGFLDQYDKLMNGIMELYTYILITKLEFQNIIVYCGYYHSNNLTHILKKYFNFKEIYSTGNTTDIEKKDEKNINNCLYIDKKIFN
jgi:hypothetical protein